MLVLDLHESDEIYIMMLVTKIVMDSIDFDIVCRILKLRVQNIRTVYRILELYVQDIGTILKKGEGTNDEKRKLESIAADRGIFSNVFGTGNFI